MEAFMNVMSGVGVLGIAFWSYVGITTMIDRKQENDRWRRHHG